jgi:hypothetical protein
MSTVETYLDELFDRLAGTGAAGRRALAEADDHLHSAVAEGIQRGLGQAEAEREAVDRFGPPAHIAAGIVRTDLGRLIRQLFMGTWLVGAVGALTIGLSGIVAALFGTYFGAGFVAGDGVGVTYTADRCADYFEYVPNAASCAEAAAVHHLGEVEDSRLTMGVLGLLALLAFFAARRFLRLRGPAWTPRWSSVAVVLLALFAVAAATLGGLSAMELAFGQTSGVGGDLAAGIVAGVAALVVAVWSLRRARSPQRTI